jgi:hypothetical protein
MIDGGARLRVGVVGPSRRRNGLGPYVARFLTGAGARVSAVAASSPESAAQAARRMERDLADVAVRSFATPQAMMRSGTVDAVAICSPAEHHERQLAGALDAGLHAFCEKPLVWSGRAGDAARSAELVRGFRERGVVLHQNAQWPFLLDDVAELLGSRPGRDVGRLEVHLSPPAPGPGMFPEGAPHAVSLMVALGASGRLGQATVNWPAGQRVLEIAATAPRRSGAALGTRIVLTAHPEQPRPAALVFDGAQVERVVLSMDPYRLALRHGRRLLPIADPLEWSVRAFLARVAGARPPRDEAAEPIAQAALLERLWAQVAAGSPVTAEAG